MRVGVIRDAIVIGAIANTGPTRQAASCFRENRIGCDDPDGSWKPSRALSARLKEACPVEQSLQDGPCVHDMTSTRA